MALALHYVIDMQNYDYFSSFIKRYITFLTVILEKIILNIYKYIYFKFNRTNYSIRQRPILLYWPYQY